mmetsp:Transcript_31064/g.74071  ORF Transcript_31064/g.74071 Transcript_31064/m.74071 type:complete len:157 (+) Transcript_31064:58-528(+)
MFSTMIPRSARPSSIRRTAIGLENRRTPIVRFYSSQSSTPAITRLLTDDPRMSKVVVHGGIVYISGQTDATANDIVGQTRNTLQKVDDLLEAAGTSKKNLLTASIWLKDITSDFQGMNGVWNEWLDPDNKPVRATVEAALAREVLLVEVQVTAAIG